MSQVAKRVVFVGRVQGVGFRFTAHRIADRYGLTGWVRNLRDGTVEMLAQGASEDIAECIRDVEESFQGYVAETRVEQAPVEPDRSDFKITF
jgi:acylphosphatase